MEMKKLSTKGAAILAIVLAGSCGSSKNALQTNALEGEWNVVAVNGKEVAADKDAFIGLNLKENRIYGHAGCNRIMGNIQTDKGKAGRLSFDHVASTRMLCKDMDIEQAVLEALGKVAGYKGTEKELTLTDGNGNALLTLGKRPAATLASLGGKWNIAKVYDEAVEEIEKTKNAPFLEFDVDEMKLHGNAGCNTVNGGIVQDEGKPTSLKFDKTLTTMMAGPGMTVESKVLKAMNKVRSFIVKDGHTAALLDENGAEALTLVKQ